MIARAFAFVALIASTALAQTGNAGLPTCAQSCVTNFGGCNQVDVKCICSNQPLLETLSCCVSQKCSGSEVQQVIQFADALCGGYGVTTLPTAATCSGTASATASSTSSGSSPASASSSPTGTASTSTSTESSTSASAAAATTSSSFASKQFAAEGMGLGMAVLGALVAL